MNTNFIAKNPDPQETKETQEEQDNILEMNKKIHDITLDFLMPNKKKTKYMVSFEDKQKYTKDILKLTKNLLCNNNPEFLLSDVQSSFNQYIHSCVYYFQTLESMKEEKSENQEDDGEEDDGEEDDGEEDDEDQEDNGEEEEDDGEEGEKEEH